MASCQAKDAAKALETERQWFQEARHTVCLLADGSQESAVLAMSQAMTVRLDGDVLPWVEFELQELSMSPEFLKTGLLKVVDTSERHVIRNVAKVLMRVLASHFEHPLGKSNPLVLIAMFLGLLLQLIGSVG